MTTRVIGAIIVPAVMISACAILQNGIILRYAAINNLLRAFNQEIVSFKQGQLGHDIPQPERSYHLEYLIPKLLYHHHLLHEVLTLIYFSMFIFVVDMLMLAVSIITAIQWITYLVLAVFLIGVGILCWSLFLTWKEVQASHNFIQLELNVDCPPCHRHKRK